MNNGLFVVTHNSFSCLPAVAVVAAAAAVGTDSAVAASPSPSPVPVLCLLVGLVDRLAKTKAKTTPYPLLPLAAATTATPDASHQQQDSLGPGFDSPGPTSGVASPVPDACASGSRDASDDETDKEGDEQDTQQGDAESSRGDKYTVPEGLRLPPGIETVSSIFILTTQSALVHQCCP